jgi:hypothetical protein
MSNITLIWIYGKTREFGNFLAQNLILPGTLAIYRIVNIWNDQQMSLISHFRSFNSSFQTCRLIHWGTCCAFILNLVNKKGLPVWKLAYSFSVYIILPENTHQYLFAAAEKNSPWNIFHSRFAIFRRHFWKLELKLRKCDISDICWSFQILTIR